MPDQVLATALKEIKGLKPYYKPFLKGFTELAVYFLFAVIVYNYLILPHLNIPQRSANMTNGQFVYTYSALNNNTPMRAVYIINTTYATCVLIIYANNAPTPIFIYSKGLFESNNLTKRVGYFINISSLNPTLCDP